MLQAPVPPREPNPTGGQPGHPGRSRERPVPNAPPLRLSMDRCTSCGTELGDPADWRRRTITDLPPPEPLIFEVEIPRYNCPGCHARVEAADPFPPNRPFGFVLMARVVHLRMLGLSVAKVVDYVREAHGVRLSTASVLNMERWTAETLGPLYEGLKNQVRQAPVVNGDKTSFRIGGQNGWRWVFTHLTAVVYRIAPSRAQDVVREMLEGFQGTLVRDGWKPYDAIKSAKHQLDLLHVSRWLERAEVLHRVEPRPLLREVPAKLVGPGRPPEEFIEFADGVRQILQDAVGWSERHPMAPRGLRLRLKRRSEAMMLQHLNLERRDDDAIRISNELRNRGGMLFTFMTEPGVPWHNNSAESQIRQGVLFRKVSGGRRTWRGAWVLERLLTVYRTCKKRGLDFLSVMNDALRGNGYPLFGSSSSQPQT
ncbi:MAG: IS66 family transposase [Nitrososphaerota archaeon]|nr:IS66 family transposase [Nitrososphaerota archaeon]